MILRKVKESSYLIFKKELLIKYLNENHISVTEFCKIHTMNYRLVMRLIKHNNDIKDIHLCPIARISIATGICILDLLEKKSTN